MKYLALTLLVTGGIAFLIINTPSDPNAAMRKEIREGQAIIDARHASLRVADDILRIEAIK